MKIEVKQYQWSYPVYLNGDGEFRCLHEDVELEYEAGGDGYTEPRGSYSVYCNECHNDDVREYEIDGLIDAYSYEPDPDWEYEQQRDMEMGI